MLLVHVGLGKTATTSLQKHIFPGLAKGLGCTYNDPAMMRILSRAALFPLSDADVELVRTISTGGDHIVSLESLVGWNPVVWDEFAERNLSLFGEEATILITVREPLSWMTSVYQEMVHEGNIVPPQEFFVNDEQWQLASRLSTRYKLDYLNVDAVDFRKLHKAYSDRFRTVVFTDVSRLGAMDFLDGCLDIDEGLKKILQDRLAKKGRLHKSYSSSGMFLTLKYERLLKTFRIMTYGSQTKRLKHYRNMLTSAELDEGGYGTSIGSRKSVLQKIGDWLAPRAIPRWSSFIKGFYDKIVPYRKYKLPENVYLNRDLLEANRRFIEQQA